MQKKPILTVLCSIVAMIVASIAIVLVAAPHVDASNLKDKILVFSEWDDYDIDEYGVLYGLSQDAMDEIWSYGVYEGCHTFEPSEQVSEIHLKIPAGVKEFNYSGNGGYMLNVVELPEGLEKIECRFGNGAGFTELVIPESVTTIERIGLAWGELKSLTIPAGVTEIAEYAFDYNYNLTEIIVKNEALMSHPNMQKYINDENINVHYVAPTYAVTFDVAGGSTVESQTISKGGKATKPENPTKAGYKFLGWFNGDDEYDFDSVVNGSVTLTAKWEMLPTENNQETVDNATKQGGVNGGLIGALAATAAGILTTGGAVAGVVLKRRRLK